MIAVMAPGGDRRDIGNPPTDTEVIEDVDVPEWLQILEDEDAVLLAEEGKKIDLFA
jgi:hypothetical protein